MKTELVSQYADRLSQLFTRTLQAMTSPDHLVDAKAIGDECYQEIVKILHEIERSVLSPEPKSLVGMVDHECEFFPATVTKVGKKRVARFVCICGSYDLVTLGDRVDVAINKQSE